MAKKVKNSMRLVDVAELILQESGVPMHYKKIYAAAENSRLFHTKGKTPWLTLNSHLHKEIKSYHKKDTTERFEYIPRGYFGLKEWNDQSAARKAVRHPNLLSYEEFLTHIENYKGNPHVIFLGAGASVKSGMLDARDCIWDLKERIYSIHNRNANSKPLNFYDKNVRKRIQDWMDNEGRYPKAGCPQEYSLIVEAFSNDKEVKRSYFQGQIVKAKPSKGYNDLCKLFGKNFIDSVWTTNFDGLVARSAANNSIIPYEVGIDSQPRLNRIPTEHELLIVSLHGDYRYDKLMNEVDELKEMEEIFYEELKIKLRDKPLLVIGYSGRDESVMNALNAIYSEKVRNSIYWLGYEESIPENVEEFLENATNSGNKANYISTNGFDELMSDIQKHFKRRK